MTKMDEYLKAANHVLDNVTDIPKVLFSGCAGILLLNASEVGFVLSGGGGSGVLLSHKGGKWSDPVAVDLIKVGAGAVFGFADRDTVVVLNHFAMKRLLEGEAKVSLSEDIGAAAGPVGASAESAIGMSEKAGGATAFIYTYQNGAMLNIEATAGFVEVKDAVNKKFYGTDSVKDIVEGKVKAPDGSGVEALKAKVEKMVK